jgi:hypothetical protein
VKKFSQEMLGFGIEKRVQDFSPDSHVFQGLSPHSIRDGLEMDEGVKALSKYKR